MIPVSPGLFQSQDAVNISFGCFKRALIRHGLTFCRPPEVPRTLSREDNPKPKGWGYLLRTPALP